MLLRHEIDDLSDMVETSSTLYDDFGEYNKSKNDMRNFYKGGFLKFSYHADTLDDFKKRFQGKQFAYIGVDEITPHGISQIQKWEYAARSRRPTTPQPASTRAAWSTRRARSTGPAWRRPVSRVSAVLQHPVAAVASCARYDYRAESRHDYPAIVQYRQTGQTGSGQS